MASRTSARSGGSRSPSQRSGVPPVSSSSSRTRTQRGSSRATPSSGASSSSSSSFARWGRPVRVRVGVWIVVRSTDGDGLLSFKPHLSLSLSFAEHASIARSAQSVLPLKTWAIPTSAGRKSPSRLNDTPAHSHSDVTWLGSLLDAGIHNSLALHSLTLHH